MSLELALQTWFSGHKYEPLGDGHIHDTYLVEGPASDRFVLQRVNELVFNDGDLVMSQTGRLLERWSRQNEYQVPQLVASSNGRLSERLDGELWRVWRYMDDTSIVDPLMHPRQAAVAATAFARFQVGVQGLALDDFVDPIPGFLQLRHYLGALDAAVVNPVGNVEEVPGALWEVVESHRHLAMRLQERGQLIHGDCKLNNLLYDLAQEQVIAIIDFDTAMRGHWAWDFGDLVRSLCFSASDPQKMLLPIFTACVQGFANAQPLTNVDDCTTAPRYVAYMLGVRFLTDHLEGDRYFRVQQKGENLQRAAAQFALLQMFDRAQTQMLEVADRVLDAAD